MIEELIIGAILVSIFFWYFISYYNERWQWEKEHAQWRFWEERFNDKIYIGIEAVIKLWNREKLIISSIEIIDEIIITSESIDSSLINNRIQEARDKAKAIASLRNKQMGR